MTVYIQFNLITMWISQQYFDISIWLTVDLVTFYANSHSTFSDMNAGCVQNGIWTVVIMCFCLQLINTDIGPAPLTPSSVLSSCVALHFILILAYSDILLSFYLGPCQRTCVLTFIPSVECWEIIHRSSARLKAELTSIKLEERRRLNVNSTQVQPEEEEANF